MDIIEVDEFIDDITYTSEEDNLREYTIEEKWEEVERLYKLDPRFSVIKINESIGTALHVAVIDDNEEVVKNLVDSIISHNPEEALQCKNEKGDTPLHLAASRGFKDICQSIIGKDGERKYLIDIDNNNGETPLFLAALSWQKQTFLYLFHFKLSMRDCDVNYTYSKDLIRNNGDSILHCAIRREFFDLALIIINIYPSLIGIVNKHGFSPLKILATRPSAFQSGCKIYGGRGFCTTASPKKPMSTLHGFNTFMHYKIECVGLVNIISHYISKGILVEILNVEEAVKHYAMKQYGSSSSPNICPKNYDTCYLFLQKCKEYAYQLIRLAKRLLMKQTTSTAAYESKTMGEKHKVLQNNQHCNILMQSKHKLVPENYATCFWFMKFAYIYILGLLGVGVEEIQKMKQKHKWSSQLLNRFLESPYESYFATGVNSKQYSSGTDFLYAFNPNREENSSEEPRISDTIRSETAILTAARNGIVEIVNELITKIPSSIHDVDLENKNVLLLAVENRRTNVVEALRKRFKESKTEAIFDNLIQGVDIEDNTVLHLAAITYDDYDRDSYISGSAFKMIWNIKWFEYTKGLVPEYFTVRTNKKNITAGELFKESHARLEHEGNAWFIHISKSCSVVAVLLAGVAFASTSTVPGGNKSDTGEPTLKGKPAFDTFAMSSLSGLCFSVTALVMFLSIITSQKEPKDVRINLPRKLLLGLSSLFLSMVALFVAFCSTRFFLINDKFKHIVFLIYAVTCFPLTLYAVSQLPLYNELLSSIFTKVPKTSDKEKDYILLFK